MKSILFALKSTGYAKQVARVVAQYMKFILHSFLILSLFILPMAGNASDFEKANQIPINEEAGLFQQLPAVSLELLASPVTVTEAGESITYSYTVTNSGDEPITDVGVNDDMYGSISLDVNILDPGMTATGTYVHTVTQEQIDSGELIVNNATATTAEGVEAFDGATVEVIQKPSVALGVSADPVVITRASDVISYTYIITNNGNVTLSDLNVDDDIPGVVLIDATVLAPSEETTGLKTYPVNQSVINAGADIVNTVSVTSAQGAAANASVTVSVVAEAGLDVSKSADPMQYNRAGEEVTYVLVVENTGDVSLNNISVNDPLLGFTGNIPVLDPNQQESFSPVYSISQNDMDAGSILNRVTAEGTGSGGQLVSGEGEISITALQEPNLEIEVVNTTEGYNSVNDLVSYEIRISNIGNVTLTNINVSDALTGFAEVIASLPPDQNESFTVNYSITLSDMNAGQVTNSFSVEGNDPNNSVIRDSDQVTINGMQQAALTLTKSASPGTYDEVDDEISYSIEVTNTGDVSLADVTVTDNRIGINENIGDLDPGISEIVTGTYSIVQQDLDAGTVVNTASVSGTAPGNIIVNSSDEATVTAVLNPALSVTKTASPQTYSQPGQEITYSITVQNTGNVVVSGVTANDAMSDGPIAFGTLNPGQQGTETYTYTVGQADINAGEIENTVNVSGEAPNGADVTASATETINASQQSGLSVTKTASPQSYNQPGQVITYTISVQNTGNVPVTGVTGTDEMAQNPLAFGTVNPGQTVIRNYTYSVSQADINAGEIENTVNVSGEAPNGEDVTASATETISANQQASISVTKAVSPGNYSAAGNILTYALTIENTGNVPLTNVEVSDPQLEFNDVIEILNPGSTEEIEIDYEVTQANVDFGNITNRATVTGTVPGGESVTDNSSVIAQATRNLSLLVVKTADKPSYSSVNEVVNYTIVITNNGNLTLSAISVIDEMIGLQETLSSMAPGVKQTYTGSYSVEQADINAGSITNTVEVSATGPSGTAINREASVNIEAIQEPAIAVTKSASAETYSSVGDQITYTIDVENTGNTTLTSVVITDGLISLNETVSTLLPGESDSFTRTYTIVQADITRRSLRNGVTVRANSGTSTIQGSDEVIVEALLAPVAENDNISDIVAGDDVVINILENDVLNDGSIALPGLVSVDLDLNQQGVQSTYTVEGEGVWTYNATTGEVSFSPQAGFTTDPTPLSYRITEIATGLSIIGSVIVDYNEGEPFAFNDTSTNNTPGTAVTLNILENDRLSDGTPALPGLVTIDLNVTQAGIQESLTVNGEGVWSVDPENGDLTFTPAPGFTTNPSPLIYSLIENITGLSDLGSVIIGYTEQPPVANDDLVTDVEPGTTAVVNILENDELSDGTAVEPGFVTIDINTTLAGVQTELLIVNEGTWNLDPETGILSFTPEAGFTSTTSPITYMLTENITGMSSIATITVSYAGAPPFAIDDTSMGELPGTVVTIPVLENDSLSDRSLATPSLVVFDLNLSEDGAQNELVVEGEGTWNYNATNGTLTFNPLPGFWEDPTPVTYRLCGIYNPDLCDEAVVTIDYDQDSQVISIALVKSGTFNFEDVFITYNFEVINNGNVPVWGITISDEQIGVTDLALDTDTLQPGVASVVTAIYEITEADTETGSVTNTALASGITYQNITVSDTSGTTAGNNDATITFLVETPSILIEKELSFVSPLPAIGDVIEYNIIVTNNGNVNLTNTQVEDPLTGFEQQIGEMLPGASMMFLTSYQVQAEDIRAGIVENIAIASGTAPDGIVIESRDSVLVEVDQCEMVIPNGFSPNDDGIQDTWRITCMEIYPNARVEIFNRSGNRVYEKRNYGNVDIHGIADAWWDGYATSKRTFGNEKLPAGTYYYVLYLGDGLEPINGYVFLNR